MSVGMKALLWKDLLVNRWVLAVGAVLVVMPYLVLILYALFTSWSDWWSYDTVLGMAIAGTYLATVTIALLGGYAFAAERADRSAEFLAYLPPSRLAVVASKAVVVVGASVATVLIHQIVILFLVPLVPGAPPAGADEGSMIVIPYIGILMLGVAWLFSTFVSGPALAAGCGMLVSMIVPMVMYTVYNIYGLSLKTFLPTFNTICVIGGVSCFVAGAVYYLRRFAP